jgi:hypothetical protein
MRGGSHRNEGDMRLLARELIHGSNLYRRESGGIQFVADACDPGIAYAKVGAFDPCDRKPQKFYSSQLFSGTAGTARHVRHSGHSSHIRLKGHVLFSGH